MTSLQLGPQEENGPRGYEGGQWVGGQCVTDDSACEALSSLGHKIPSLNSIVISIHGT